MSRTKGIEEDQDPPRKHNRSTPSSSRASTLSQTIQIITNKFKLSSTSPKLRRLRRKVPYGRVNDNQQELGQEEEYNQEIAPSLDESIETEVFFKKATTTSTVYQINHSLDDTIPYFDPLLELRRDTYTPLHLFSANPPSPSASGDAKRIHTPRLLQITDRQLQAIPGTSSDTTHAELNPEETTLTTNTPEEPIDLRTTNTQRHDTTIDLREEDPNVDDWNTTDVIVTEDDRDTPYTTAHNTIIIDDSDDDHSDRSTESERNIAGFSTPPLTPSLVVYQSSPAELPEKGSGFGNPPWARDQNTAQSDIDLPQPQSHFQPKGHFTPGEKED